MEPRDGDARKKRKGTPARPARKRRKHTDAAAPLSLAPPPSVRMGYGNGGAPTSRSRREPTGAAAQLPRATPPPLRMGPGDAGAPTAWRRRKPPGTAAPPSMSVRMARGDGGASTGRRARKTTGASASPSLAPPLPVHMPHGDGGVPPARRRRRKPIDDAAPPPSLPPEPSMRMGPGNAGAPTARRSRKPTGTTGPPSIVPPPALCMTHGDEGTPPQRKRKGSSLPRDGERGKRGRATNSNGSSSGNGSAGGHGGQVSSNCTERSAGEDPAGEDLAGGQGGDPSGSTERSKGEDLEGDDPAGGQGGEPNGSGAGGAGLAAHRKIVVAHTANTPPRFKGFIRSITSLIPCEDKGKSYECSLGKMNAFLKWSKAENAFFFEWNDDRMEMTCWIHNIKKGQFFKFTVNAAFSHQMDDISVERAAVAFSTNFVGNGEYWSDLKDTLLNMFGSFEDKGLKEYDYLYVFTRVGESICFRSFKITSFPKADDSHIELVLKEINTTFSLKLVHDQVAPNSSYVGAHLTKNKTLSLRQVTLYSISNGQMDSSLPHCVDFSGTTYSILLENGGYLSSLEKLDGFNTSLAEIVVKEPLLKIKDIIGSKTNKTYCFARERCKAILQSLFAEIATLLESGKCIGETSQLFMHNILVRGTTVRLCGVDLIDYTDRLATRTVQHLVAVVRNCFPVGTIPLDLHELLQELGKNPLDGIRTAADDCSLMKAEARRTLLINLNSEYMTDVEKKTAASGHINEITFFKGCPYLEDWEEIMKDNEYMVQVCNVETSDQENESDEDKDDKEVSVIQRMGKKKEEPKNTVSIKKSANKKKERNAAVIQRMEKKKKVAENTASIKKFADKKKNELNRGKLQFSSKRNFLMHMPEKARKDGIIPFRLGLADHILTAYFPRFLRFVQKRMRDVKAQRGIFNKRSRPSYGVRGQRQ